MGSRFISAVAKRASPFLPVVRLAYLHMFLVDDQMHSSVHIQNPFSFFDPTGEHLARVAIGVYDKDGRVITRKSFFLGPFESLHMDIKEIATDDLHGEYGTIGVDVVPSRSYRKFLKQHVKGITNIASPFWMRFSHPNGSEAYVHSIEADRSQLYGVPSVVSKFVLPRTSASYWESDRTITLQKGEMAKAFLVNHSGKDVSPTIEWREKGGLKLKTQQFEIPCRGIRVLEFGGDFSGDVYTAVNGLPTSNSKPYVMVCTPAGQFALTHG